MTDKKTGLTGWQDAIEQLTTQPRELAAIDLDKLRDLIDNDGYAISFQSMRQYRTALLKELDAIRQAAPECGMCNDSGIVGYPPDQYEDCPDCIAARASTGAAPEAPASEQQAKVYFRDLEFAPPSGLITTATSLDRATPAATTASASEQAKAAHVAWRDKKDGRAPAPSRDAAYSYASSFREVNRADFNVGYDAGQAAHAGASSERLYGFDREDLEAVADGLEAGYEQSVDVGGSPLDGNGANLIASTTMVAARFIRAAMSAATEEPKNVE